MTQESKSMLHHIVELRKRLLICVGVYGFFAILFMIFAKPLFDIISNPLLAPLPEASVIATEVTSTFMAPLKCAMMAALMLCAPFFLYQAWSFVAPGLYPHEKRPIVILSFLSVVLFYAGASFAYFVVCPLALQFFSYIAPQNVKVMTDINHYLSFMSTMILAFGFSFQLPIAMAVLIMSGISDAQTLRNLRRYVIVGAFIVGMLLTPPDVLSQILLAIPLIALYELGILLGLALKNHKIKAKALVALS